MIGFQNPEVFILLIVIASLSFRLKPIEGYKKIIGGLNVVLALLLILAASGPYIIMEQQSTTDPEVKVIEDVSESSKLIQDIEIEDENAEITETQVNSDRENFRSQVKAATDPGETIVFVSDLNADIDGLPEYFEANNISSNVLTPDIEEEHSVKINGPSNTVIGAENSFEADVSSTTGSTQIDVGIDDRIVYTGEPPHDFELTFEEQGDKEIWARTHDDDVYSDNNEYFKTVSVQEKPSVASITDEENNSLESQLEEFYDVQKFEELPSNLDEFDTVLMKQSAFDPELEDYLIEGGGLVYTGREYESDYLPVESSGRTGETDAPVVILTIDISVGTEDSGAAEAGKQIAYDITQELPENSRVGVVAYNRYGYDVLEPKVLNSNRDKIEESIASLEPDGPTFHNNGLRTANHMVDEAEYSNSNIVMIADGKISNLAARNNVDTETIREADRSDAKIITVGVGDEYPRAIEDEDREFLTQVAERSEEGFYLDGHSTDQLDFAFQAGGGSEEMNHLTVTESDHFVTDDRRIEMSLSRVDSTESRSGASQLISTADGSPFLTTWRYGLGKIAVFTGDNQDLEQVLEQEPGLAGRTISWTVGAQEDDLRVEGDRQDDDFRLISSEPRDEFTRISENRYKLDLEPNSTGFHESRGKVYAKNYRSEIEELGYNEEAFSEMTVDGRVYGGDRVSELVGLAEPQSDETDQVIELTTYVLAVVLVLYLSFVGLRKRNGLV